MDQFSTVMRPMYGQGTQQMPQYMQTGYSPSLQPNSMQHYSPAMSISAPSAQQLLYSARQQQNAVTNSYVSSVSLNLLLKFVLSRDQLKKLKCGHDCPLDVPDVNCNLVLGIDPDCHLNFQPSDDWESFDLDYAFVISKGRAFSLEESSKFAFLTPFQPTSVDDEEVMIHCKVNAYPKFYTMDDDEGDMETVKLPTVLPSPRVLPSNYKNEKVINFILKGIMPNFDVDMAIEILSDAKIHKCEELKILCMEYLMANTDSDELTKISKAARDNHCQLLQEKCLIDFENCVITGNENKSEENKMVKKENKKDETKKK